MNDRTYPGPHPVPKRPALKPLKPRFEQIDAQLIAMLRALPVGSKATVEHKPQPKPASPRFIVTVPPEVLKARPDPSEVERTRQEDLEKEWRLGRTVGTCLGFLVGCLFMALTITIALLLTQ